MNVEQLLQMLRDGGMDDEAIKALLTETIAALEPKPEEPQPNPDAEEEERKQASEMLGVNL